MDQINTGSNIEGGVKGIIVYRESLSNFKAYERNCTYQPTNTCATVSVDDTNLIAVDSCCGSMFSILDGSIWYVLAVAEEILKNFLTLKIEISTE